MPYQIKETSNNISWIDIDNTKNLKRFSYLLIITIVLIKTTYKDRLLQNLHLP